jgi:rhamnulokinase
MQINTLYQMMSLVLSDSPQQSIARTFLTSPDLLNYWLTGAKAGEFTIATTTQMFNPLSGDWAYPLLDQLGIPTGIFPEIVQPGTCLGTFQGIPVITPACHDTGNAVAAVPARRRTTPTSAWRRWSLVGLEVSEPVIVAAWRPTSPTRACTPPAVEERERNMAAAAVPGDRARVAAR